MTNNLRIESHILFTVEVLTDGRFKFTIDGYSKCLEPDQAKVLLVYLREKLDRK